MKLLVFPFHSILLCVYPIIYLYARNIVYIPFVDTIRFLALSVGLTILFLFVFRIILKGWEKAGILCSLLVILFFSFGHIDNSLEKWASQKDLAFDVSMLSWIWLCIFLLLSFIIIRARFPQNTTKFLNLSSAFLIIFPLTTIISIVIAINSSSQAEKGALSQIRGEVNAETSMRELSQSELPDIYYIIFDGYLRADILNELYSYDNSSFIEALEERGFYIVSSSRSNYLNTNYSLNTSLNVIYFHEFPTRILRKAKYNLLTNYVNDFLHKQDYQIVVFDSGTRDTNNQYADIFISSKSTQSEEKQLVNPFEQLLLRTTMGLLFFEGKSLDNGPEKANDIVISSVNHELSVRRERINHALAHLPDYASKQGHYFLFAHIYLPHIPFLYGPGGEELKYHPNLNLYWYEVEPENYIEYYTYQLDYINQAVLNTIDNILAKSEKPIVIILQSDHGDARYFDWEAPTAQGVNVNSAILNAIYFSDRSYQTLYPTMTPVNTFRVILNHWFGTQYPVLPDKVFFHEHPLSTTFNETPDFIDSCTHFNICLPAHPR